MTTVGPLGLPLSSPHLSLLQPGDNTWHARGCTERSSKEGVEKPCVGEAPGEKMGEREEDGKVAGESFPCVALAPRTVMALPDLFPIVTRSLFPSSENPCDSEGRPHCRHKAPCPHPAPFPIKTPAAGRGNCSGYLLHSSLLNLTVEPEWESYCCLLPIPQHSEVLVRYIPAPLSSARSLLGTLRSLTSLQHSSPSCWALTDTD